MSAEITSLARYERLPGEYFALQVGEGEELRAAAALRAAGHDCEVRPHPSRTHAKAIWVADPEPLSRFLDDFPRWIEPGAWIVFRRNFEGESLQPWAAAIVTDHEFQRHFRRAR